LTISYLATMQTDRDLPAIQSIPQLRHPSLGIFSRQEGAQSFQSHA
jgi:hypothetical protein